MVVKNKMLIIPICEFGVLSESATHANLQKKPDVMSVCSIWDVMPPTRQRSICCVPYHVRMKSRSVIPNVFAIAIVRIELERWYVLTALFHACSQRTSWIRSNVRRLIVIYCDMLWDILILLTHQLTMVWYKCISWLAKTSYYDGHSIPGPGNIRTSKINAPINVSIESIWTHTPILTNTFSYTQQLHFDMKIYEKISHPEYKEIYL